MSYETAITIKDAINHIQKRNYALPSIQREFVWTTEQIETLFDSLMRDYPIGTFLFWQVDKNKIKDFQFYDFLNKYHGKTSRHNKKADLSFDDNIIALLDGQQRMTSLYLALCGSYSDKKKHARRNDMGSYQEKYLFLNLLKRSDDLEMEYDFRFLTKEESQSEKNSFMFQCSKILDFKKKDDVFDYLEEHDLHDTSKYQKDTTKYARNTLAKYYDIIHKDGTISYYLEKSEELDKVLQIFIRINSGGTKLSYSDLLLSIATAQWKERDAREIIHEFVDEVNDIGDGFGFNKDIVLKSCLVLPGFSDVKFKVDNFTKNNMAQIEKCWDKISSSIRRAIQLVSSFGYNKENLLATNAIIPIAYYIYKNNFEDSILQSSSREDDRKAIREWLARVLLKGVFGGQPDSVYPVMRRLIDENLGKFPLSEIIERYRGDKKNILFSDDEIEGLLDLQYGKAKTYCTLTLLYPHLNHNSKFHQDHIHPQSFFDKKKLREKGISEDNISMYILRMNELANLQLLEATQNIEKKDKNFTQWLNLKFPSEDERRLFLSHNYIALDTDLSFDCFIEYMDARRTKLRAKLVSILSMQT
jgi:uncharacterized protein with ParB-like and HNH nuclease domain